MYIVCKAYEGRTLYWTQQGDWSFDSYRAAEYTKAEAKTLAAALGAQIARG